MSGNDPARWERVQELFDQASALPPHERGPFLSVRCGDDAALRSEVESLLGAGDRAGDFIDSAISGAKAATSRGAIGPGTRLGRYRVIRELGRGGMGAVYLAERADHEYQSQVAIKVVRDLGHRGDLLRRLRAERQILANLDHPNIATLLDGGATDDGYPYFVMEYVEGIPIDRYCDHHRLTIAQRLALLLDVAAAVHHANRNLVVHRDLKPSNILVTRDGTPKLLDFGIAKLLGPRPGIDAPVTQTSVRLLTPAYASPEQVSGGVITTATDVYSLGVVCYELLTGSLPYPGVRGNPLEMGRMVLEAEPIRPSAMAHAGPGGKPAYTPDEIAAMRGVSRERLRKELAGDIDTILLTALRKESGRRYATVADLAEDIRRHLDGLPVRARGDTFSYRAAKFMYRHRLAVSAAAAALVVAIGTTIFYTVRLARERDRAVAEATRAEQVASFLTSVFEQANPEETGGETVTARQLLDRGAARVAELDAQPEVQAAMLHTIAQAYIKLGVRDSALPLLERALATRERVLGAGHADVAQTLLAMGELQYEVGQYDSSLALIRRAESIQRQALPPDDPAYALTLNNRGWLEYEMGNLAAAESLHRHSLAIRTRANGPVHPDVAESQNNLAVVLHQMGDLAAAESLHRIALATRRETLGADNPLVGFVLNNLAAVLEERRELAPAESLYREALAIERQAFGEDNPRLSTNYVNLGRVLGRLERYDEAEAAVLRALRLDAGNPQYEAYDYRTLGDLLAARDPQAAERYYRSALEIYRGLGVDAVATGSVLRGLALLRLDAGQPAAAEPLLAEALESWAARLPADHVDLNHLAALRGEALAALGDHERAESLLVRSRRVLSEKLAPDDARLERSRRALAALYRATGRPADP